MRRLGAAVAAVAGGGTYELNLLLADAIGHVERGVPNVDTCVEPLALSDVRREDLGACPICLEGFGPDNHAGAIRTRACGHVFCRGCISTWLSNHTRCPVCNHELGDPGPDDAPAVSGS